MRALITDLCGGSDGLPRLTLDVSDLYPSCGQASREGVFEGKVSMARVPPPQHCGKKGLIPSSSAHSPSVGWG